MHRTRQRTATLALLCVPLVHAAHQFPELPVRPAHDYELHTEKSSVTLGVQPIEDPADQKTYFDTELKPKGLIPVFVVIENGSATDTYLLDKSGIGYGGPAAGSVTDGGSAADVFGGLLFGAITVHNTHIRQNLLHQELQSKTLSPGSSTHGFLYIPVPKAGPREQIHLQIPITKAGTHETHVLNLTF